MTPQRTDDPEPFTAAILAGGRARRLGGRDKSALPVGPSRFIDRQLDVLRTLTDQVIIVSNEQYRFEEFGVPVVPDVIPGAGALGGLYAALVSGSTRRTLVVACDMPFLTADFLAYVVHSGREMDAAVPRTLEGYQPLCASYTRECAEPIRRRIEAGALRVTEFLGDVRVREIGPDEIAAFDPDGALLLNVNTPADYARALALLETRGR